MAFTDMITFLFSSFFLLRGYSAGFMNSLLPPVSIMVGTAIGILYYQNTKAMGMSLSVGLLGPLVIYLILKTILNVWSNATNTNMRPGFLSGLTGAILNLVWGWVFIIPILILLSFLPPMSTTLTVIHNDVVRSVSYTLAKPWQEAFFASTQPNGSTAANNPGAQAQSLAQDPRFQKVLQDPEIQEAINSHNIVKLMSNPKMIELTKQIMNDPAALKKVMAVYNNQENLQANPTADSAPVPASGTSQ